MHQLQAMWREARALAARGAFEEAATLHRKILADKPDAVSSWRFLAAWAQEQGDFDASANALSRCLALEPHSAEGWRSLGVVEMYRERWAEALVAFKETLALEPGGRANLIYLGAAAAKANQPTLAADCLSMALQGLPRADVEASDQRTEPVLQAALDNAIGILETHLSKLAGDEAGNLEGARWRLHETREPKWRHPDQRPERFFLPALDPKPWFDAGDFPWAKSLGAAAASIIEEVRREIRPEDTVPYIGGHTAESDDWKALADKDIWRAVHLYRDGRADGPMASRFPATMEAMKSVPLYHGASGPPEVFFSLLAPGGHIPPHYGKSNARLTVHLPLVVPEGQCSLCAGHQVRVLEAGRVAVFDDSFIHEARNEADSVRINLVFDVWHPALSAEDISRLQRMGARYEEWYRGRGRRMDFLGVPLAQAVQAQALYEQAEERLQAGGEAAPRLLRQILALNPNHKKASRYQNALS
ncbi:MAG: aspartyl/asparaginyl beta-hydroxylase domain-containing protein [Alphaproteobacteria bacterium]|nr:aspartyl/asparaginyl beta-hydroxylase domain-containing protein [Alphaproteobacteria bacterium]